MSQETDLIERLAKDVLTLADHGGMPDSFWWTDQRIRLAIEVLGWSVIDAREWARVTNATV